VERIVELTWVESHDSNGFSSNTKASEVNPSLNRQLNRPPGGLSEKPNAEPGEQIKVWTEISQDSAIKPHIRVEAIQSLLGARLNVNAATNRWVWSAFCALASQGRPIEDLTVADELIASMPFGGGRKRRESIKICKVRPVFVKKPSLSPENSVSCVDRSPPT
jgi:hypothetical protein